MISVGDAVLKIGVDTKGVDKGLKGLKGQFMKHSKAIGIGMTAVGGTILAVGIKSVKTYAEMGDEVQKMALRTGFSTEALSELRHAADISGASLGTLEKGVKKMAMSIADAKDGLATYTREFDKIGMAVEELEGLSPEEQFFKIAEAIARIEDPTIRAASAQKILGRAGTELLPLFAEGEEGMAALRQEAHDLGIVFDQEAADKAAKLTDEMHRMKEATSGVQIAIAEHLAPIISSFIETKVVPLITKIKEWTEAHPALTKKIVIITGVVGGLLVVLGPLLIMLPLLAKGFTMLGAAIHFAMGPIGLLIIGGLMILIPLMLHWESIIYDLKIMWIKFKIKFCHVVGVLKETWQGFLGFWKGVGETLWKPIQWAIDKVLELWGYLKAFWAWLNSLFRRTPRGYAAAPGYAAAAAIYGPSGPAWAAQMAVPGFAEAMGYQKGGIIMKPTLARLGERAPEAVIPLDRLKGFWGPPVTININEPHVRDDRDIDLIGEKIVEKIRLRTGLHI